MLSHNLHERAALRFEIFFLSVRKHFKATYFLISLLSTHIRRNLPSLVFPEQDGTRATCESLLYEEN